MERHFRGSIEVFSQNGWTSSTQPFPNDVVVETMTLAMARHSMK